MTRQSGENWRVPIFLTIGNNRPNRVSDIECSRGDTVAQFVHRVASALRETADILEAEVSDAPSDE